MPASQGHPGLTRGGLYAPILPELVPAAYIGYERVALYGLENSGLRVTFDWNLRWRDQNLHLDGSTEGRLLLPEDQWLMEIKLPDVMPCGWPGFSTAYRYFPTSFSKYGTAYRESAYMSRIPKAPRQTANRKERLFVLHEIFSSVFQTGSSAFELGPFLACTAVSLLLGLLIAWTHAHGSACSRSFLLTLVMLPAVVQTVIMLVNGSIGTGIAVAGALV